MEHIRDAHPPLRAHGVDYEGRKGYVQGIVCESGEVHISTHLLEPQPYHPQIILDEKTAVALANWILERVGKKPGWPDLTK